jgi:ABC-type nitrate/sulfonate/bicarbonate transport system permease component
MPITARPPPNEVLVRSPAIGNLLEDTMREWIVIAVGTVIGVTIGIVIGETFEVSRLVGKIIGISCAFFGACLAMGIATMAGWVKPFSENA